MKRIYLLLFFAPLFSYSQLINGGMENYVFTPDDTLPDGWTTESYWSTAIGQSNNAYSGNYSFVINTWYNYSPGIMMNGTLPQPSSFFFDWIRAGTPISSKPARLTGYYMYTDTVWGDSAIAKVALKKWNTTTNAPDTVAIGTAKLPFASSWTQFTVDMVDLMPGVTPDSVVVYFMTFDYLAGTQPICNDPYCRFLYLDDLSLDGVLNTTEINAKESANCVFYNNMLSVKNTSNRKTVMRLHSLEGKLLMTKTISSENFECSLHWLESGIYFVSFDGNSTKTFRFVKE